MKCKICNSVLKTTYKGLFDDRHGYPGHFKILGCEKCGFYQTSPQISKNAINSLYENYYPRKNLNISAIKIKDYQKQSTLTIWRKGLGTNCHFHVKPGTTVLDIGSGVGYSLLYLKNQKCSPYGIDPDINGKKVAKKFNIPFHYGFIEDVPFKSKKFDFITASQVIEHSNDPIKFLKFCKSRVKENGKIILSFPNANSLTRKMFGKRWLHWHIPYHVNHFSKRSVFIAVNKAGLKVESLRTITPNMWTNLQLRRLLISPHYKERDLFWDGKSENSKKFNSSLLPKVTNLLENYNFINRIVDFLGLGDSFLITLRIS